LDVTAACGNDGILELFRWEKDEGSR
jgi:hypothetical protein